MAAFRTLIIAAFIVALAPLARADVRLPSLFADHMVVQRETDLRVWGTADPAERVRVTGSWNEVTAEATADDDGDWSVELRTPEAGGPHRITIAGENTITIDDVLSGEVWICSGQSNMEWKLSWIRENEAEIAAADFPQIRWIDVPNAVAAAPRSGFDGKWTRCTPDVAPNLSAVGYYFGRKLHRELRVPIGLITSEWGGTPAESWATASSLTTFPAFADQLAMLRRVTSDPEGYRTEQRTKFEGWQRRVDALDPGVVGDWAATDFDHSSWKTMPLPGNWEDEALPGYDGTVWHRRTVDIPEGWVGRPLTLSLGPLDDNDDTYVNGVRVGGLKGPQDWRTARHYPVASEIVTSARLTIAVRVHDLHGGGGFHGAPSTMKLVREGDRGAGVSLAGEWHYRPGVEQKKLPRRPAQQGFGPNTPSALFNGMIAPLTRYRIAGTIWYQGESNQTRARQYRTLFPTMIQSWRDAWRAHDPAHADFPFYYVQIAPFGYGGRPESSAELREAQMMTLDALPKVGMAVTMDIGDVRDIHPRNKVDVGERLARWALNRDYGREDVVVSGPLYQRQSIEPGRIRLHFAHTDGGLKSSDGEALTHFRIAGADRVFHSATAHIDGDSIVVRSDAVKNPIAVRFAFTDTAVPNLVNGAGLPASSFRTDDWQ